MKKSRLEVEKCLENYVIRVSYQKEISKEVKKVTKEKYNIPKHITSDCLTLRMSLSEISEFVMYALIDCIETVLKVKKSIIPIYFTEQEAEAYKEAKYKEEEKVLFPLKFKVLQVNEDQWIGTIDTKTMMEFRSAQIINYNRNAQRTMQKVIKKDKEIYKPKLNQNALEAIERLYRANEYIPTPFTLNIPETETDFYYDDSTYELTINSLDHFDIVDGYHRYVAASRISDVDEEFNYRMELRLINFSETKAKQFIYQEDQKTKMNKIDSDSMNMNNPSNIVVNRLNENPDCNLKGLIDRNGGIINFGDLAQLVNYFYFKNLSAKENQRAVILTTVKELKEDFNLITEYNIDYFEKKYSYKQLVAVMYLFFRFREDKRMICKIIDQTIEEVEKLDNSKFYSRMPRKAMMNEIEIIVNKLI